MYTFLSIVYVFVCLFLILVVLLQPGRGGMGGAFGGGSSQTVFGGSGAGNFLTRLTAVCAALFMILSASLAYLSSSSDKSLLRATEAAKAKQEAKKQKADEAPAQDLLAPIPQLNLEAPAPQDEEQQEEAPSEAAPSEAAPEGKNDAVQPEAAPAPAAKKAAPAAEPAAKKAAPAAEAEPKAAEPAEAPKPEPKAEPKAEEPARGED